MDMYNRFERAHAEWERKWSTLEISHQIRGHESSSSQDCEKCGEVPDEPMRKDYFPKEPQSCLLSELLATVIGVANLDFRTDSDVRRLREIYRR